MKRIAQLAVLTALACSAQVSWSEDASKEGAAATNESAENYLNVAQVAAPIENRQVAREAQPRKQLDMLREIGLRGEDGFPQKGGPIDD